MSWRSARARTRARSWGTPCDRGDGGPSSAPTASRPPAAAGGSSALERQRALAQVSERPDRGQRGGQRGEHRSRRWLRSARSSQRPSVARACSSRPSARGRSAGRSPDRREPPAPTPRAGWRAARRPGRSFRLALDARLDERLLAEDVDRLQALGDLAGVHVQRGQQLVEDRLAAAELLEAVQPAPSLIATSA